MTRRDAIEPAIGILFLCSWIGSGVLLFTRWGLIPASIAIMIGVRQLFRIPEMPIFSEDEKRSGVYVLKILIAVPSVLIAIRVLFLR